MRIQSIAVSNLRGVELARVEPANLTYLLGHNGEGKSTVLGALKWALMGWLQWTDKKGSGAADLVRHGHKSAVVEVVTDLFTVRRELGGKGKAVVVDGESGKDAEARLTVSLPRAEVLDCLLTPVAFTSLGKKEQQDILFSLVDGSTVDAAWVTAKLSEPEQAALSDDLATILTGKKLFDVLHESAYDKRTKANGRRDALRKVLDAATQEPAPAEEPESEAQAETRSIEELQGAVKAAQQTWLEASTALRTAASAQEARRKGEEAVERWRTALVRSKDERKNYAAPACEKRTRDEVSALEKAVLKARAAWDDAREAVAGTRGQLNALAPQVEKFAAGGEGACLVLSTITCPLSAEQRAEAIEQARAQIADLRKQEAGLAKKVEAACKAVGQAEAEHKAAQEAMTVWAGFEQRLTDLDADIKARSKELEQAQADLDKTPTPEDTGNLQTALDVAQADLDLAHTDLQTATDLQSRRQAAATAKAVTAANTETELMAAEQEWQMLDALVKRLEPSALPAEANRDLVGTVLDRVNEALANFTDFSLSCEPGAEFRLLVTRAGQTTPVAFLSTSEQYRVGVACQVAFAILTGFGVVVVDGADVLDNQSPMAAMLYHSGVQAIVAATVPRDKVEPGELPAVYPRGPGIASYWVTGGTQERGKAVLLATDAEREAA